MGNGGGGGGGGGRVGVGGCQVLRKQPTDLASHSCYTVGLIMDSL